MEKKITAIILNYKHERDTAKCISSIQKSDLGNGIEIMIVDNSPSEKNRSHFKKLFPKSDYIASPSNLGFAGGNNIGIKKTLSVGADYILIVNPDVILPRDFFIPLLKHFDNKKVGIVAPSIIHKQKGMSYYGLEGKVDWSIAKPEHRNIRKLLSIMPINSEFVTFACVLISIETFRKVGLLDDRYFMYFEDVDYCLSARKKGVDIILDPTVLIEHNTSSSFSKPTGKLLISYKSHLRFINKWLPLFQRIKPLIYAHALYPYLYVLWTYHYYKYGR
jgi:GT2 family glycosyltransferase